MTLREDFNRLHKADAESMQADWKQHGDAIVKALVVAKRERQKSIHYYKCTSAGFIEWLNSQGLKAEKAEIHYSQDQRDSSSVEVMVP